MVAFGDSVTGKDDFFIKKNQPTDNEYYVGDYFMLH